MAEKAEKEAERELAKAKELFLSAIKWVKDIVNKDQCKNEDWLKF